MSRLKTVLGAAMLAFSLNSFAGECPALSGEYTIGSNDADFSTIADALNALKCGGVSGATNFLIQDGTYNEKVVLSSIPGADAMNRVTFESKSGNNADVVISYGAGDAALTLNGVSYVTFENLTVDHKAGTYGNSLRVDGKSSNLSFKGVVFDGVEVTKAGESNATVYFSPTATKTNINFEDCEINNGSIGLYKAGLSAEAPDSKTTITGTLFFNQYETGLALANEDAPVVSNNVVSSLSSYKGYKAIGLDHASNTIIISNNIVNAANGAYGIALTNCTAQPNAMGQINNNSVAVGGAEAYGLYMSGNTDNQVLNFNRIKLSINGAQNKDQAYYRNAGSGNNVNMLNNIFYDINTGGYTILGNTYKDMFNQLPGQSNPTLSVSANGLMVEKVSPIK